MKKNFVTTKIQKVVHRTSRGEAKLVEKRVSLPVQDDTLHDPNIGHLRPRAPSSVPTKQMDDPAKGMKAQNDRGHPHGK